MTRVLFAYRYLSLGGVETLLRARIAGLDGLGIEAHAFFLVELDGRSLFADCPDRVTVGSVVEGRDLAASFDLLTVVDTPELMPADGTGQGSWLVECHTAIVDNLGYLREEAIRSAAGVLVPSQRQAAIVSERLATPLPIAVVPNLVQPEFLTPPAPVSDPPARPVVAVLGRLDGVKDWGGGIAAVGAARAHGVDCECWLVGCAMTPAAVAAILPRGRAAGMLGRLRRVQAVGPARLASLIDAVRDSGGAVVSTSRAEAFGLTIVEAMARGCPVVAPDLAPFTEYITDGENGLLYAAASTRAAGARIAELLGNDVLRRRIAAQGMVTARSRFSPGATLPGLAALLQQVAAGEPLALAGGSRVATARSGTPQP